MPVKPLPSDPNLNHLKHQARDLLKAHRERVRQAAQRIREFHPRFAAETDAAIFDAPLKLSDAQLAIARESGFASWARLKRHIESHPPAGSPDGDRSNMNRPHHERIEDPAFRRAVNLLDAGDEEGLHRHLLEHADLVHRHVEFEGGNYFRNPTLLEFIAENPIRRGSLPPNIVQIAKIILDAGAKDKPSALNETLVLVGSGCVPRQCHTQVALIDLLCDHGANPASAMSAALAHGEFEAASTLIRRGAPEDFTAMAAMGRIEAARRLLPASTGEERHRALALAAQFGHTGIVRLLLDAGEDPSRYNPVGFHSHSTPLHQAALAGHEQTVRLLVQRGATLTARDTLWQGTPAGWAKHEGRTQIEDYLRAQEIVTGTNEGQD